MGDTLESEISKNFSELKIDDRPGPGMPEIGPEKPYHVAPFIEQVTLRLLEKLKHLPAPLNNMGQFLQEFQGVLTGSFLLSCFFTDLKPDDIDLVFGREWLKANNALFAMGWHYGGTDNVKSREGYCNLTHVSEQYYLAHKSFPGLKLNFIVYGECQNQDYIRKRIEEYFDFDGCTLNWDGKKWSIAKDIDMKQFLNHKIMKYRESQLDHRLQKPEHSAHKLMCNDVPWVVAVHGWIMDRLKKYEARGFTISNADYVKKRLQELLNETVDGIKNDARQQLGKMMDKVCSDMYIQPECVESVCQAICRQGYQIINITPNARDNLSCVTVWPAFNVKS
jgi:hypothetical protein